MKFNKKKIWDNVKEPVMIAGAGTLANTAIDAALQAAEAVIPASITSSPYWVNGGKLALGAIISTASKNKLVQLAGTGLATVGASNLVSSALQAVMPDATDGENKGTKPEGQSGVPFIGRTRRMGQRGFRSVRSTGAVPFMEP